MTLDALAVELEATTTFITATPQLLERFELRLAVKAELFKTLPETMGERFDRRKAVFQYRALEDLIRVLKGESPKHTKDIDLLWFVDLMLFHAKSKQCDDMVADYKSARDFLTII